MEDGALYLAMSGVLGAVHTMKALVVRGLMTPDEVDATWDAIISPLQDYPGLENVLTSAMEELITDIRKHAADWQQLKDDYPDQT